MNHRPNIEIYFVLYLAALLLLLSDSPKRETELASMVLRNLLAATFTLQADRTTLLCRANIEADTVRVVHCDSTAIIIPTGMVDSVLYTISAVDQSSGLIHTLQSPNVLRLGAITLRMTQVGQALRFNWTVMPTIYQPKLYQITVTAHARPLIPNNIPSPQRQELSRLLRDGANKLASQLTLLVAYLPERSTVTPQTPSLPLDSAIESRIRILLAEQQLSTISPSTLALIPEHSAIRTLPFVEWNNRISIYGANPERDLIKPPQVTGINTAFVSYEGNTIIVRGISTQPATAQVRVTITHRNGSEASTSFTLRINPLEAPTVPSAIYPGVAYTFDPKLSALTGTTVEVTLRDQHGRIRASSIQGEAITFTPSTSDTGGTFYFERSVGGKTVGQVIAIPCEQFPAPEILSIQKQNDRTYLVRCRGYGLADDHRSRVRITLDPPTAGNVQELYGEYSYDKNSFARLHTFQIIVSSTLASIRAVNGYGRKSDHRLLQP